ncbi:hypothetical protein SAMN05216328_15318 [Ensifer sp. YR511]|nr:hypothetical protein SAMN05216328_15318 [Ensifer sp. YR511]
MGYDWNGARRRRWSDHPPHILIGAEAVGEDHCAVDLHAVSTDDGHRNVGYPVWHIL